MDETQATIIGLITIIVPIITGIAFILKFRNDVNNLKEKVKNLETEFHEHPLFMMFKQWEIKYGAYEFFNSILKNSNVEKDKDDIRSSYFLEYVATEFDIQGLELDWTCVGWDADFRLLNQNWDYYKFIGKDWQKIQDKDNKLYLKNTYRVLLTRARQGVIIFIPKGDKNDSTRKPSFYDETYEYLKEIGLKEIV